jgi:phage portal protein BeeE
MAAWNFRSLFNRGGINRNQINSTNYQYLIDKPAWLSLSNKHEYRKAVAENPVLYGCISILAKAAANGTKYLVDLKGNEIPWNSNKTGVANARRLFVERPNPLQSPYEFNYERMFQFFTYGNNFINANNPLENFETDITNVLTLINLPSEYTEIRQTGKLFDQINIEGIIEKYVVTSYDPVKEFKTNNIIHFNDINTSSIGNSIIGSSRLENLKWAIQNTQLAFEAMNVILKSRGMQGIIKLNNKDGNGTLIPVRPEQKKEVDDTFKNDYGIGQDQKQYLISYSDIEFIRTVLSPIEMGIYDEFSHNANVICNGLGVPPELYKSSKDNPKYENQIQSERRMYQGTIIPMVKNEDQYYTERLQMRKYGFELRTDWTGIDCLADGFKEKATALSLNTTSANTAYNDNAITLNQYLELIELPTITNGDFRKSEMPQIIAPLAEKIGIGGTGAFRDILSDQNLTPDQKKWSLIYLFGLEESQANQLTKENKNTDTPAVVPIVEPVN